MIDKASQYTTTPLTRWSVQMLLSVLTFYVKLKLAFEQAIKRFYSECELNISCCLVRNILTDVSMGWENHVQVSYVTVCVCYCVTVYVTMSLCPTVLLYMYFIRGYIVLLLW